MLSKNTKDNLDNLNLKPVKHAGQNFLVSEEIIEKIISSAKIKKGETILEVGPGTGNLTEALLSAGAKVTAIEKDHNLSEVLKSKVKSQKLKVIEEDILNFDEAAIKKPYRIIANIPYYLTGQLLQKFLSSKNKPKEMVLMVQKEVGERITANPPKMNYLSAFVQTLADAKMLFLVEKTNFWPQPDVDSAIIKLVPHKTRINKPFIAFLKTAFKQPRKTLFNNLRNGGMQNAEKVLIELDLDKKTRGQDLSIEQLKNLFSKLK